MAHIGEKLRELLENPELRNALADAFYTGIDSPREFDDISLADHIRHARGMGETPFKELPDKLDEAMQSFVLDRLPQPAPITAEDLTSLSISHLVGIESSESNEDAWRNAYDRFVSFVLSELDVERPCWPDDDVCFSFGDAWEFEFLNDAWTPFAPGEPQSPQPTSSDTGFELQLGIDGRGSFGDIWSSGTGFRLIGIVEPGLLNHPALWDNCRLIGKWKGYCTESALQHTVSTLEGLLGAIAKSVVFGEGGWGNGVRLAFLVNGPGRLMMSTCLTAIWERSESEKDELLDRLRNAVVLLSQADEIASEPVALSLTFAAIEALV